MKDDRLVVSLSMEEDRAFITDEAAGRLLVLLPGLANQVCLGGKGEFLKDELPGTETAHAVEHVAIALMLIERDLCEQVAPIVFTGHTTQGEPDAEGIVRAKVTVSFENDLVAMSAIRTASEVVAWTLDPSSTEPDIPRYIVQMHSYRDGFPLTGSTKTTQGIS